MLMGNIQGLDIQIPHDVAQYWGWFLAFGIALVVLGVAAIGRAVTATIISMLFFGWLLVLASGIGYLFGCGQRSHRERSQLPEAVER